MPATKALLDRLIERYQRYAESGRQELERQASGPERIAIAQEAARAEAERLRREREGS